MRLTIALLPFLHIALCGGAPAARATRAAAPVAAPAAPAAAPPPPAAAANNVVPLPQDEILDPSEMANKATTDGTKNGYRDIVTGFCVWLYDSDDELTLAADAKKKEWTTVINIGASPLRYKASSAKSWMTGRMVELYQ